MNKKNIYLVLFLLTISVSYFIFMFSFHAEQANSPDESQVTFFSDNYLRTGELRWYSEYDSSYGESYFRPRGAVFLEDSVYVPLVSPHYIILFSTMGLLAGQKMTMLFFSTLCIVSFYLFIRELTNPKEALFGTIILSILPPFFFYSFTFADIIPSLSILLFSFFLIMKFDNSKKPSLFFISGLFFSLAVIMRIHYLPLAVFFLPITVKNWKLVLFSVKKWEGVIIVILTLLALILLLSINFITYNNPFYTGRAITGDKVEATGFVDKITAYGLNKQYIGTAFNNYILFYSLPLGVFLLVGLIHSLLNKNTRTFSINLSILFILSLLYYGSNPFFYNFNELGVQGSLARYFLPLYCLGIIFFFGIINLFSSKTKIFLIFASTVLLISFSFYGDDFFNLQQNKNSAFETRNSLIQQTSENSIFLVKQSDKIIVPDRQTMLIYDELDLEAHPQLRDFYTLIDLNKTVYIIDSLQKKGVEVYISKEPGIVWNYLNSQGRLVDIQNKYFLKVASKNEN